jgi:integrase
VLKRLVALHGDKLLLALTKGNLEDYKAMRAKVMHARVARRLSPWSVNSELRILKCVLNRAVDDGYLMISPAARGFKFLRQDKPVVRRVAWETIFSLLRAARRPLNVVLLTAVKCGLRPGEVLKLQVTDVMEATDFLRITSTPDHPTKTRAERLVPLPDDVRAWLQWLVQWVVNPRTGKALVRDPLKQPYLFCHRNGIPIKSMKTAFTSLCAHVGIVGLRLKDLRKVYASALAEANVHPEKVRLATGHSDVKVLLEHYTTVELRDVTRVVRSWPCLEGPPT